MPQQTPSHQPASNQPEQTFVLSRQAARELDHLAQTQHHIPSIVLMENAARSLACAILRIMSPEASILIVCGPGNNGGDGLALARHLHNAHFRVSIVLTHPPTPLSTLEHAMDDVAINLMIVQSMKLRFVPHSPDSPPELDYIPDMVVDALLGTGLDRPLKGTISKFAAWINALGQKGAKVLAVDIPTGLDADTGQVLGSCVRADYTVSFVAPKIGFSALTAQQNAGEIIIGDISSPPGLLKACGTPMTTPKRPDPVLSHTKSSALSSDPPLGAGRDAPCQH